MEAKASLRARARVRLLAAASALRLLLGAFWVAFALGIVKDVVYCARLGASLPDDGRCTVSLSVAPAVVITSMIGRSILWGSEAKAEEEEDKIRGGGDVLPKKLSSSTPEPQLSWIFSGWSRRNAEVGFVMMFVVFPFLYLTLLGSLLLLGLRVHPPPPDSVPVVELLGSAIANVGCMGISIAMCCLVIPYAMLRLRKAFSVKDEDTGMMV